ncbi:GntR family transcriptional regulator [Nonomuraea sp. NBC_01738]|uniref:GntR family transcriptional regulator n=1 Tax=Nonomuraea sp. NBC_01738 TaxID=2976003 RepID=UPI002E15E0DB|nr:GntR family transcriptional regulator [Nonomuraea sp. NBC_01738]
MIGPIDLDEERGALYTQIVDAVVAAMAEGRLVPGDRLPAERDLAIELGVSRDTLRQALRELQRHGHVVRTVGRGGGTFVAEPKVRRNLSRYSGLADELREQDIKAAARVLSARGRSASPAIAAALGVQPGEPVHEIVRVRLADDRPMALEHTYYAQALFPGLLDHPLDGSIYELLRSIYGETPVRAVEYLEPILAGPDEARALGIEEGAPLMYVERIAYDAADRPVEFGRDVYRGDRTRMVVWGLPER